MEDIEEPLVNQDPCQKTPINWWKTVLTGIIAGILIITVLIITQSVSLFWGVFLFVIPISAGIVVYSLNDAVLTTFVFFMMLSGFSFAIAISSMYVLLTNNYSRAAALISFYLIWLILTGLLFYAFRDKLKQKCEKPPTSSPSPETE